MDRNGIGGLGPGACRIAGWGVGMVATGGAVVGSTLGTAGSTLGTLYRGVRSIARPAGMRAAAVEAGWLTAHLALYPWGVLAEQLYPDGPYGHYRTETLNPVQRGLVIADIRAARTPILLVHGHADNRSVFAVFARALRRRGFGVVHAINYSVLTTLTGEVRGAARRLGQEVEQICEQTGADEVHLVGHSLGGLVARYYVQRLGGHARVHTLVTLGTPHGGTAVAYLLPTPMARQLRPDSDVVAELADPAPGCRTRFLAVWSALDQMVIPQRNARLDHPDLGATNLRLRDVGHLSLLVDPRAVHAVATTLSRLEGAEPAGRPERAEPPTRIVTMGGGGSPAS
ncbi:MAG: alpha/beta fold hydrolase [Pseudonocardiaceae bacterium]